MIELKNIYKIIKTQGITHTILNNINLQIRKGEIFGLLGRSGAGKSTLLRCINLLEKPTQGDVIVNGRNLTTVSQSQLREQRKKIGFIFQHFNLLNSRNVFKNIALPLEIAGVKSPSINKRVSALLEIVGLADKHNHYPFHLSGGQKQRAAIARALAVEPHVLLCDEATSSLDAESTQSILQLLKEINQSLNLTIVLITHELEVIKQICERVGVIEKGELIETNLTTTIFSQPKSAITQELIKQSLHLYQPYMNKPDSVILKLTFIGQNSEEPLISNLAKKFNIVVNIKQALIEKVQSTTIGYTICELSGPKAEIDTALNYINTTSVKVEILHA